MPASMPIRHCGTFTSRAAIRPRATFSAKRLYPSHPANHMQRVLAGIDANRADGCGHGGVLLVLLSLRSLSERFGAGARPVHSILRARSRLAASRATMRARHVGL